MPPINILLDQQRTAIPDNYSPIPRPEAGMQNPVSSFFTLAEPA